VKAVKFCLVPLFALGTLLAHAQVTATAPEVEAPQYAQRWDIFGGAAYAHFNPGTGKGNGVKAVNLLGWDGSATVWVRPLWGIEATGRGVYGDMVVPPNGFGVGSSEPMSEHLFLFGPSFRFHRTPRYSLGMHALIGAAYGVFDSGFPAGIKPQQLDIYNDKLAFGYAVGGIADYNLTPSVSIRFIGDWQPTHYGFSQQNEFAGSVGIVYKLGKLAK
jgi:opacity protein-like surface antigen